ncbi:MAG: hypothetical protein JWO25_461 [Alphaproteobacteria bacterium]|nr:hypothetical protein [Alphaproteobacteria bacterium]
MKKLNALISIAAITLALAACGPKKDEGGLTAQDNQELNNAAEMLDASPDSLVASDNVALGNGEGGEADDQADANAAAPGNSQ